MDNASRRLTARHRNVLTLDGGGVRGLSSLLILEELMRHINNAIEQQTHGEEIRVGPRDVFDFVAGTSTGGLIAIMLGKLGMSPEESIQAYRDLSRKIFKKRHIRGRITHGLAPTKYSGSHFERHIKDLIAKRAFPMDVPMVSKDKRDYITCAVVCREHVHQSKYSDFKRGAVPICSARCDKQVVCLVSEAARATSAAPTFFPVQKIGDRYFVDGGMEFNNPSFAIYEHYSEPDHINSSGRTSNMPAGAPTPAHHDDLDFSRVRIVNLGTGTKSEELPPRQRDRLAALVPPFIRMSLFLKRTLTEFAVEAENTAGTMRVIARGSSGDIRYERFSADTGVCYIKMDRYKKLELEKISNLTRKYLENTAIQARLQQVGKDIARDYLHKHHPEKRIESAHANDLNVPHPNSTPSRGNLSLTPELSEAGPSTAASTDSSQIDTQNYTDLTKQPKGVRVEWASPPPVDMTQISPEMMSQEVTTTTESTGLAARQTDAF